MLEVAAAREIVLRHAKPLAPAEMPLVPALLGRLLAEDVSADLDSPPFAKSLMDGYAVRSADCAGPVELRIVEEVAAGAVPTRTVRSGETVALFTGAPMPDGADAVVMKERTEPRPDGRVFVNDPGIKPGRNMLERGREMRAGDVVLPTGTPLTPVALGLLASVGRTRIRLQPPVVVGIIATGNELVEADAIPGPGQIRNSNGPMLAAMAARAGGLPLTFGIARDDADAMRTIIDNALMQSDVLLLAGGVSAGKFDLVPEVLQSLGVETHFHKIRLKPGKPLLFGTLGRKLVFGLPGNPVSAFVGFELFVRPALRAMSGHADPGPVVLRLPLSEPLSSTNDRPTYTPAKRSSGAVRGLPWFGSADLRGLLAADALIALPPGEVRYDAGQMVEVIVF